MRNLAKWLAVATLALGVFMFMPKLTAAQDDLGQQGFGDLPPKPRIFPSTL